MLVGATLGDAYFVRPRVTSFRAAIARTVRPREAAPIARAVQSVWRRNDLTFAETLGLWFKVAAHLGLVTYFPDPQGPYDYWRSPETTIDDGGGDCDDLAILAVSTALCSGFPARLVLGTYRGIGHAWMEGADERGWFLFEATSGDVFRGGRPAGYEPWPAFIP
jgi:transglutaminase-like putative cysteine protease